MSNLCVLIISGYMALTPMRAQELVETGNSIIGITEKVRYIPMRNRYPVKYTDENLNKMSGLVFDRWRRYVNRKRATGALNCSVHILDIPSFTGDATWAGGYAVLGSACKGYGFSLSNGREYNYAGLPRLVHSEMIYVHERLHTFGATHNDAVPNVMNSYIPGDVLSEYPILESTRKEMCR